MMTPAPNRTEARNFWINVSEGALVSTAMAMVPITVLMPAYARKFTDNEYLVNLVVALFLFGVAVPQVFMARHLDRVPRKKRLLLLTGIFQRLPWLLLALAAWIIPPSHATAHLALLFAALALFALSSGANVPVWLVMIGKLVPEKRRGRLMAWRQIIALTLAIGGAAAARHVLATWPFPHSYALLFFTCFLLTMTSLALQTFLREERDDPIRPPAGVRAHFRDLLRLLREDRNYAHYVVASLLFASGGLYGGLITSYGIDRFGLGTRDEVFAWIAMLSAPAGMLFLHLFGRLGDRHGHKRNHVYSALFVLVAMAALHFGTSLVVYIAAYVLIQVAVNTEIVSRTSILLEFGGPERAAAYVSVKNTLTAPVSLAAPLLGAWLARRFGYDAVFLATFVIVAIAAFYTARWVREPRRLRAA
ncbi:MAG TPA: MFS transporter [Kiritimatiellia bacterium]|nr:MFS transporter [Kiritimatiellia bacterium]